MRWLKEKTQNFKQEMTSKICLAIARMRETLQNTSQNLQFTNSPNSQVNRRQSVIAW